MKSSRTISAAVAALTLMGTAAAVAQAPAKPFVPVTDAMLANPDPGDWLMFRRTLNSWGYSPLDQVNARNVGQLKMVWSRPMGPGVQEATPLIHDGVMYLPNPSDLIQAFDAATGDFKWEYKRQWVTDMMKVTPSPTINRSLAIYGDKIIDTSADDFVFALDAQTGKLAWQTSILDPLKNPAQETTGAIIVKGKIISGRGCEPKGGPDACVITAHDAVTGKELWRTHTIPKPGEPGDDSWGGIPWEQRWHVGTWMAPSYDPETNLLIMGTSVTSPAPKFLLAGNDKKYLYHNSTLALDADTGKIVWYYQHIVDHWDMDHPFERLLVDTAVTPDPKAVSWINPKLKPGERRKVVTGIPGKTGIIYTLDRKTGEFLWATPTVHQNMVKSIDGATGEVTVNPDTIFTAVGQVKNSCPTSNGGKNWPTGSYNPRANVMYYPLANTCGDVSPVIDKPTLASLYGIRRNNQTISGGGVNVGSIHAISAETGRTLWTYNQRAATLALVSTGGGLIFNGDTNGHFRALDDKTGKVLWEVNLGSAVTGFPITYLANGKQYVAVSTGSAPLVGGLNGLTPEIHPGVGNTLFVFALP